MNNYIGGKYIKTSNTSGYIPYNFVEGTNNEYIIVPSELEHESSGEIKKIVIRQNKIKENF